MKTVLVLACLLLAALTVTAHGGDGGPPGGFGGGPGGFGGPVNPGGFGGPGKGGKDGPGGKGGPWGFFGPFGKCQCSTWWNPCKGVVGSKVMGCPNTNQFLQCNDAVCSNQTCPSGQVWNQAQNKCAECDKGMHVAANKQVCVCDQGTTLKNRTCVDCPKDSVQEDDRCYCNVSKAFDYKNNACKDCPSGSTLRGFFKVRQCQCDNNTQFWNEADWACEDCPGEWLPKPKRGFFNRQPAAKCTCTGTNQIFDRESVTCITCPPGTTASRDNSQCACQNRFQFFNTQTKACECVKWFVADSAGTGCVPAQIPVAPSNPAAPANPAPAPGNP